MVIAAREFIGISQPVATRLGIEFEDVDVVGDGSALTCPMHPSEVASILSNLFSNAAKAVRRTGRAGRVRIRVGNADDAVFLEFLDTGDGIPLRNHDRVFEAFFTTSTPTFEADDMLSGSGLGLKIVRDIARSYGGEAYVADPPEGFATSVRVEVPAADSDTDD